MKRVEDERVNEEEKERMKRVEDERGNEENNFQITSARYRLTRTFCSYSWTCSRANCAEIFTGGNALHRGITAVKS